MKTRFSVFHSPVAMDFCIEVTIFRLKGEKINSGDSSFFAISPYNRTRNKNMGIVWYCTLDLNCRFFKNKFDLKEFNRQKKIYVSRPLAIKRKTLLPEPR